MAALRASALQGIASATLGATPPGDNSVGTVDEPIVALAKY